MGVLGRDRRFRSSTRHEQNIGEVTVASHVGANDAVGATAMTKHDCPGAIAEQHTSISIAPVRNRRQLICADHQRRVVGSRSNELLCDLNPEQKSSAGRRNIEAGGIFGADFFLDETGGRRKNHVGRGGGDEYQVDFFR